MPVIDIHHPHALGKQRCRMAVEAAIHDLAARFELGDLAWQGDTLAFARPGVEGRLSVSDTDAHVWLQLGPLLGLLRGTIEAEVRRQLDLHLA
ncbi:MAG TPA: polyhydroxyalkanoic acid system family protein [Rhodanobacteraceae bacterium]